MLGMRWPVQAPSDKGCFWKIDLAKYLKRFDLVIYIPSVAMVIHVPERSRNQIAVEGCRSLIASLDAE